MHNPLRSEADAFRMVVIIGAAAGAVIALSLLTEPRYGAVLGAALIGLGIGLAWRGSRGTLPRKAEIAPGERGGPYRVLVIANETVGGRALLSEIRNRCRGRNSEILVVTPALTSSQLKHWVSDVDEALVEADRRREASVRAIEALGLRARGEVGDSEPNVAIEDALATFPADEVIISTHPPERSRWLERGVVERARAEVDLPITHVVTDLEAEAAARA
jgi:GABA permease